VSDACDEAQAEAEASEPIIWLLGKTQAGKTSIVAEITGESLDEVGNGFEPKTKTARVYPWPKEQPILRFLDTRGLADVETYDASGDVASARAMAHVILAVVRSDDQDINEIVAAVREAREVHPEWPVIVAQTCLHNCYRRNSSHILPYPFDGTDADFGIPGLPGDLKRALMAQRRMFARLPGKGPVLFVPLDFTQPEQGLPPGDYGVDRLLDVLEDVSNGVADKLRRMRDSRLESSIRTNIILPWAFAAAAANAVPVPILGGFGSASLQAVMVRNIAQRFGLPAGLDMWGEFLSTMGAGFALGFGGGWLAQQVLKLGLGWGSAAVAAWTFAITWGIGEAALYYCREKAAGRTPSQAEMTERYRKAFKDARGRYKGSKGMDQ